MKRIARIIIPVILILGVVAALWYYWVRPAGSLAAAWDSLVNPAASSSGELTASGTVQTEEISIAPEQPGRIRAVNAQEGDVVKADQVLVQLDDTILNDQRAIALVNLDIAKQALVQLTSPMVLANAQKTLAQDAIDVDNAQYVLDNQLYFSQNTPAIQNAQAALTLADDKLKKANDKYAQVSGNPDTSTVKAQAYQVLYAAQQEYDHALWTYNLWSGKNNQQQIDVKTAALQLAKARQAEDQALVKALTSGQIPDDATGTVIAQIQQAKLNIRLAQANLDLLDNQIKKTAIRAALDGVVMTRNADPGSVVNAGTVLFTLGRLDELTITVYVPEDRIGQVRLDQSANVTVDSFPGIFFNASVSYISDQAEYTPRNVQTVAGRKSTVFAVKLQLQDPDGKLKPGMPADVTFNR
jgi:multidrug efflux pump subunit AcrA (membrane-fusion protein)